MDRNGKKPKAARAAGVEHAERSDTKHQAHDTLERMNADARLQRERGGAADPAPRGKHGGSAQRAK